jgi:hypothetical protein
MACGYREYREFRDECWRHFEENKAKEDKREEEALIATCVIDETKGELYYGYNAAQFARALKVALAKSEHKGKVRRIVFGPTFNQPIKKDSIPADMGIDTLEFGAAFNQEIQGLPISVTTLTFGRAFNQPLQTLPITIQHICLLNMNPHNLNEKSFKNIPEGVVVCRPLHYYYHEPIPSATEQKPPPKQKHGKKCHHYQPYQKR